YDVVNCELSITTIVSCESLVCCLGVANNILLFELLFHLLFHGTYYMYFIFSPETAGARKENWIWKWFLTLVSGFCQV
ncbi:hypothetical protein ACJX0J_010788, partial [Zea mays]